MRMTFRFLFLLMAAVVTGPGAQAQVDPHFSQYYVYPSFLNPALTGAFDGNYRVSGIYRNQWGNVAPFETPGFAVDFTTNKNINLGASVLKQTVGDGGYSYTTAYGNVAYTGVTFGANAQHRVAFGIQAGMIQRRFDPSKMTWGDQWNPTTGYSESNPTSEIVSRDAATSFDAGAGVLYFDATPGKKFNLFGGFSLAHLTRPDDKFSASGTARMPRRLTVHGGARITLSESFSITPNLLYLRQGTAEEKMIGAYAQFRATPAAAILLGGNYRFKDAFSPFVGLAYRNTVLGASYDVNTSDLGKMTRGANSFEISLTFIGRKTAHTPQIEFVCPSL